MDDQAHMPGPGPATGTAAASRPPLDGGLRLALATCTLIAAVPLMGRALGPGHAAMMVCLAFLPWGWLLARRPALDLHTARRLGLTLAGLTGLWLACHQPLLSDDLYRYLWDGKLLRHGLDPYAYPPDAPGLAALRDAHWQAINHRDIATIYPPLAQLLFALADGLLHHPAAMQLLALLGHLVGVLLVARLCQPRDGLPCLLLAINPLALTESAQSGHIDSLVGASILATMLALRRGAWRWAALGVAATTGLKLVGLALAPLVAGRSWRRGLATALLCSLALTPYLAAESRPSGPGGLGHYARRWQGNQGPFHLLRSSVAWLLSRSADPANRQRGHIRLDSLQGSLAILEGGPLDPWRGLLDEKKEIPDRLDFEVDYLAGLLARVLVITMVTGLAAWLAFSAQDPLRSARLVLLVGLLFAPQVHPWYLLWLLPLESACRGLAGWVWSATVLVAYAPLALWQRERTWHDSPALQAAEFALVVLVLALEPWLEGQVRPEGHH